MLDRIPDRLRDVLGDPFVAETVELPDDYEGRVVATLVHRPADDTTTRAVLYVHGFCDYFFQAGIAEFFGSQGYAFYAMDLRKYGRSLLPHQTPNFCLDLAEYDAELDEAYRIITDRDGHGEVVVVAHSTGGLVVALWADRRRAESRPTPTAFVLNSPWLDIQGSMLLRTVGTRALEQVGMRRPYQVIPRSVSPVYVESLHRDHRGEWDFDLAWKPADSFPVRAGWLRAVRRGHRQLHGGLDVGAPVLVLTAARTLFATAWSDDTTTSDVVLDVKQIARWAPQLGRQVTIARIDGAMHDVYLSARPARESAFALTSRWLRAFT
ncbi:MAG: alpha/beta hydrolase [Nocardioidaceae bacterium]|nr:alpha/beta hydrolase [Nocardioidaceae bacterium]